MKKLEKRWNGIDNIDLYVSTKNLPLAVKEYALAPASCMAICKIEEDENGCLDEETMSDIIWQSHPANSRKEQEKPENPENTEPEEPEKPFPINKKRERFIRSKHAIDRKREIEPLTESLRPTRNGSGLKPGVKSSVRAYFKRYDRRLQRHENKNIPVESTVSPFDPWEELELEHFDYEEFYEVDSEGNHIWREAEKLHEICPYWDDEYLEEEEYLDPYDDFDFPLPEERLQAHVDALKNQVQNLINEINRLNGFIQEFNLQKLYEAFLEKNNEEFF